MVCTGWHIGYKACLHGRFLIIATLVSRKIKSKKNVKFNDWLSKFTSIQTVTLRQNYQVLQPYGCTFPTAG